MLLRVAAERREHNIANYALDGERCLCFVFFVDDLGGVKGSAVAQIVPLALQVSLLYNQ